MLPALLDDRRRTLLRCAIAACTATLAILPLTGPSSLNAGAGTSATQAAQRGPDSPGPIVFPPIPLDRDPFVADAAAGIPAVANDAERSDANERVVLRAIVTGIEPRALVEMGTSVRVVEVGDALGSARVTRIDKGEIVLSSGVVLPLTREHP